MRRLYDKPEFRGYKVGYKLVEIFIIEASKMGYKRILLDTVAEFKKAISLCKSFGFREIYTYYNNPIMNPIYMELKI